MTIVCDHASGAAGQQIVDDHRVAIVCVVCLGLPAVASADYNAIKVEFFAHFDESLKATDYYNTNVEWYVTQHTHWTFDEASDLVAPSAPLASGAQIDNYRFPLVYDVAGTQDYTTTPTSWVPLDVPSRCSISYFGKTFVGNFTAQQPPPVQIVLQQTAHGEVITARAYPRLVTPGRASSRSRAPPAAITSCRARRHAGTRATTPRSPASRTPT